MAVKYSEVEKVYHVFFPVTTKRIYTYHLHNNNGIIQTKPWHCEDGHIPEIIFHPHALTRSGIWYIMPVKFEMIDKKIEKKGKVNKMICKQIKQTKRNKRQNKQY